MLRVLAVAALASAMVPRTMERVVQTAKKEAAAGTLDGTVKMKLKRSAGAEAPKVAARVAEAMGCAPPRRVFRPAGKHELKHNVWVNDGEICGNGVGGDKNGYVDDCYGYNFADDKGNGDLFGDGSHGTHCAGTIAADNDNDLYVSYGGFAEGIVYAADNGAKIVSNSWGYTAPDQYAEDELAAIDYADDLGVAVVFAAGNAGTDENWYPAYYDRAIAVAAVDDDGVAAYFTCFGDWIDYPEETGWSLSWDNPGGCRGDATARKSAGAYGAQYTKYTETVEGLCAGFEYTFTIADTYGDGILEGGSYVVTVGGADVAAGATFQYSESTASGQGAFFHVLTAADGLECGESYEILVMQGDAQTETIVAAARKDTCSDYVTKKSKNCKKKDEFKVKAEDASAAASLRARVSLARRPTSQVPADLRRVLLVGLRGLGVVVLQEES
ncbi:serine-type endopeptidase [Aureococcus anophagefferens]|nr:serine-type endopeptidase [Aureococcus anophagefferens]